MKVESKKLVNELTLKVNEIRNLESKLTTSNDNLANVQNKIHNLQLMLESSQQETKSLHLKLIKGKYVVDKFTKGNEKFYQLLGMNKIFGDKTSVGFECSPSSKKNSFQHIARTSLKSIDVKFPTLGWTCHFCNHSGHLVPNCPYKFNYLVGSLLDCLLSLSLKPLPQNS